MIDVSDIQVGDFVINSNTNNIGEVIKIENDNVKIRFILVDDASFMNLEGFIIKKSWNKL